MTDDPETPGDGHWEVNLAVAGSRTSHRWDIVAPDADINYGWGSRIQLKLDVSWAIARDDGQPTHSGLGITDIGVKWRFLDQGHDGLSMSVYPQFASNLVASSATRGLTEPGRQLLLPLEAAKTVGSFELDGEIGRDFVEEGPDAWVAGFVVAHACVLQVQCRGEVRETREGGARQTLLNFGLTRPLDETFTLLAAAGHEIGPANVGRQSLLLFLGLQAVH